VSINKKYFNKLATADYPGPQGYCWEIRRIIETVYIPRYGPSVWSIFTAVYNDLVRMLKDKISSICNSIRQGSIDNYYDAIQKFVRRINCLAIWMLERGHGINLNGIGRGVNNLRDLLIRNRWSLMVFCGQYQRIIDAEFYNPLQDGVSTKIQLIETPFDPIFTPLPELNSPPMPISPPVGCPKPTIPVISPLVDDILDSIPGLTQEQREALRVVLELEIAALVAAGAVMGLWEIMALAAALVAAIAGQGIVIGQAVVSAIIAAISAWAAAECAEEDPELDPKELSDGLEKEI
jgi:hypothetical protein